MRDDPYRTMELGRREFVIASGATLLLAGCGSARNTTGGLPGASWPGVGTDEVPHGPPVVVDTVSAPPPTTTLPKNAGTPQSPIPRSSWTHAAVGSKNIYPMRGVNRITIHHEGWKVVGFNDYPSTAARLDLIRRSHLSRKFADIGYHYVIDRAGRVYQGRPEQFQGAHVRNNNEHNLGIMCLGNFDLQQPTDAQVRSLAATVAFMRNKHKVSASRVFTHREIVSTACPGRHLQSRIAGLRQSRSFG